jgi:Esterase-like activity of phytase
MNLLLVSLIALLTPQRATTVSWRPRRDNIDYQDHFLVSCRFFWERVVLFGVSDISSHPIFLCLSVFKLQVGLLNLPNSYVDPKLQNHTSGKLLNGFGGSPYTYIPSVGFSDIEFAYTNGRRARDEFLCLSDNGYGSSGNSEDFALNIARIKIQKPFMYRHGGATFSPYTKASNLNSTLIVDPNNLIRWENGADIQVAYAIPDATWTDYQAKRVLTGRDFDVEGMAVINENLAILGDELMPAIFAVNPTTGVVLSNFVRTPDIDSNGVFNGKFLSTRGDKVHCTLTALASNTCKIVNSSVVDASIYRKHDPRYVSC